MQPNTSSLLTLPSDPSGIPSPAAAEYHLSFSGCGFQGLYHIGVASCIKKHAPYMFEGKVAGCSAGGLIAACSICDCKLEDATRWSLELVRKARSRTFGPFHPSFDLIGLVRKGIDSFLPKDAHITCSGRLHLSLTTLPDWKNVVVNQFSSREELLNALVCTCWIPLFAGIIPPTFEGQRYIDGGFTCNLILLNEHTITVAPFGGAADISPSDEKHTFNYVNVTNLEMELTAENIGRFARIFYPPNTKDVLSDLCKRGYDDTFKYLQKHNLLSCTTCLSSSSSLFNLMKYPRRQKTSEKLHKKLPLNTETADYLMAPFTKLIRRTNSTEQIYEKTPASRTKMTRNPFSKASHLSGIQSNDDDSCENCPDCRRLNDEQNAILPEQIVSLLQNFTMNESLYNHICSFKVVQFIGLITLPIRLPLEALYFTGKKIYDWLPEFSEDFNWFVYTVTSAMNELMQKTGTNICFARLRLEVNMEETVPYNRGRNYCAAHSNPGSRRSSISIESSEGTSRLQATKSIDSLPMLELVSSDDTCFTNSTSENSRTLSIDFQIGVNNNCKQKRAMLEIGSKNFGPYDGQIESQIIEIPSIATTSADEDGTVVGTEQMASERQSEQNMEMKSKSQDCLEVMDDHTEDDDGIIYFGSSRQSVESSDFLDVDLSDNSHHLEEADSSHMQNKVGVNTEVIVAEDT